MTLENCKVLLAHYKAEGMKAAAEDMLRNLAGRGYAPKAPEPKKVKK